MKKSIIALAWIFGMLMLAVVVSAVFYFFLNDDISLNFVLLTLILGIIEIICMCAISTIFSSEKDKKLDLLEKATFREKTINQQELIKQDYKEIYKIFCNTLVDL